MIDLKKAFDTVSHDKLIKKLNHCGIRGVANDLISSYLHNRKQFVSLNDVNSTLRYINMGVPKGSIPGPLQYIIYVNDLPNAIECSAKLYAHDICLIFSDNCLTKLEQKISGDSKKLKTWLDARRRRPLAGHLFQDRWKDQGRGFILLPPWPPNCLGQMLTVRDFSQHLVSSSKTIRPNIPRGARCMGHCEMMWSAVCSLAPHSQFVRGARPHLCMDEQKRPTPERRRLSLTQAALGRPIPKGLVLALGMKAWSDDALAEYFMSANSLSMNLDKTACMVIPPSHNNIEYNFNPTINGSLLKIVNYYEYLGITVNNQLKFKFHIQLLEKKFLVELVFYGK